MATLAESFMADLDDLSDVSEDEDNRQQPDLDEEVRLLAATCEYKGHKPIHCFPAPPDHFALTQLSPVTEWHFSRTKVVCSTICQESCKISIETRARDSKYFFSRMTIQRVMGGLLEPSV